MLPDRLAKILLLLLILVRIPVAAQMFEWVTTYKTEGPSSGVSAIATDDFGNVYISAVFIGSVEIGGVTLSTAGTDQDTYLAKYDADGNFLWVRHISGPQHQSIYGIAITKNNQIVATGSFQYQLSIDGYTLRESPYYFDFSDTFLLKFDANGTVVLARNIGFPEDNLADQGFGVALDLMDNIYVAGGRGRSMFFIKTNPAGDILWKKMYGSTSQVGTINAGPITVDNNGNVFVSGRSLSTGYLHKIDTNGTIKWTQTFNGFLDDLQTNAVDELLVCGTVNSATSLGGIAFPEAVGVIGKMSSEGTFIWQRSMKGFRPGKLSISKTDEQIYFTSSINKDVEFDGIVKKAEQSSDLLIGAISPGGFFRWVAKAGEKNGEFADQLATDLSGNIFIANKIPKDSVAVFQCQQKTGQSKRDIYVAKISPFLMVPIDGPAELCPKEEASYSYTPVSDYISYQWKIDSEHLETLESNAANVKIKSISAGLTAISVETPVDLGCENFIVNHSIPVTVNPLVEKTSVLGSNRVCAGAKNVVFNISSELGNSENNTWMYPNTNVTLQASTSTQLTLNFSDAFREGEIAYVREGKCNSVVSDPLLVEVASSPGPSGEIEGERVVCAGTTSIFTVPAVANAEKYVWSVRYDGTTKTEEGAENFRSILFPANTLTAKITVSAHNQCGVSVSPAFDLEVKHKPKKPETLERPADVCSGDEVTLRTYPTVSGSGFHWLISNQKGELIAEQTGTEPELIFQFTQPIFASVSSVNMCGESPPLTLELEETKDPEFTPEIQRKCDIIFHEHQQVLSWFKDGMELGSDKMIEVKEAGEYVLTFVGKCSTIQSSLTIEEDDISEFVPNIFTPNGDEKNEYFEVSPFLQGSHLKIFNRWGKEVFTSPDYNNNWNGGGLPSGVYLYTLTSECTGRLLKGTVSILK